MKRRSTEFGESATGSEQHFVQTHIIHLVCRIINRQNAKHEVVWKWKRRAKSEKERRDIFNDIGLLIVTFTCTTKISSSFTFSSFFSYFRFVVEMNEPKRRQTCTHTYERSVCVCVSMYQTSMSMCVYFTFFSCFTFVRLFNIEKFVWKWFCCWRCCCCYYILTTFRIPFPKIDKKLCENINLMRNNMVFGI